MDRTSAASGASASTPQSGPLTAALWSRMEDRYLAILKHPFITGLQDGGLAEEAFCFYVVQDAHFLRGCARTLSVAAARAPQDADVAMFCTHAVGALEVERALHEGFFANFGLSQQAVVATPVAPTSLAYTSYLLAVAYGGSFAEALAAVLPCYWIYLKVGKELVGRGSPNARYQRWIDTYAGEDYAAMVGDVLALVDRLEPGLGAAERARMAHHVGVTSRYEWMFWDMGLRREAWPLPETKP
jgi:thiaminase (transcriptional activator TenA)